MSYNDVAEMTASGGLQGRCAACASQEFTSNGQKIANIMNWVRQNIWVICSAPDWDTKWESGKATYPNEDVGARNDVITDGDILSVVQPLVLSEIGPPA